MSEITAILNKVHNALFALTGLAYFESTCIELSQTLDFEHFMIGSLVKGSYQATTIAFATQGKLIENFSFCLKDTPCEKLLQNQPCIITSEVQEIYPDNECLKTMDIDSYLGLPLTTSSGDVIGIMVGMSSKPIDNLVDTVEGLQLIVTRASLELERKLLIEELQTAKQEAEQANKTKSDFLAMMSHEIRTPLNSILGSMHILKEENLSKAQKVWLDTIQQSSNSLMTILNDILDYSKMEANQLNLENIPFNLIDVLTYCTNLHKETASNKGLALSEKYLNHDQPCFWGDPTRIGQIFSNFISNAIKFTSIGSISISLKIEATNHEQSDIEITVQDTGIGMTPEQLEKITEPFVQASDHTKRQYGGTGLGIPICIRIAEMMNGSVEISSQPGQGSTFTLKLNLKNCDSSKVIDLKTKETLKRNYGKRVLIVEDNHINAKVAQKILANLGIESIRAIHGKDALRLAAKEDVDLILMDLNMPEMDGFEATQILKETNYPKPIVAFSANIAAHFTDSAMKEKASLLLSPNPLNWKT